MKASEMNPIYSVFVVKGNTKYDVTPIVISISTTDMAKEMACRATIELMDYKQDGLTDILNVRNRVFIYADTGSGKQEVFRGFIWTYSSKHSLDEKSVAIKCYDNLIYLQESEESLFYAEGKSTQGILSDICSRWGINLSYNYQSITHSKLALRGNLSDTITADILDLVKDRSGKKYVILSKQDTMYISGEGQNSTVYAFKQGENITVSQSGCTMDGMVTKVVIVGKAEENDRLPVEATISGDTANYGTLQKVISRDSNTTLADAKTEANNIIKNNGKPYWEYEAQAPDVPWIRKGDKIRLEADNCSVTYPIVKSVERSISNKRKIMTLTLEPA